MFDLGECIGPQTTALEASLTRMVFPSVLYPIDLGLKCCFLRETVLDHYAKSVTLPPPPSILSQL